MSAAHPSTRTAVAPEREHGQHRDNAVPQDNILKHLVKEFGKVANLVRVHAKREDVPAIRAFARAQAENHERFPVWESFVPQDEAAYMMLRTAQARVTFRFDDQAYATWQQYLV